MVDYSTAGQARHREHCPPSGAADRLNGAPADLGERPLIELEDVPSSERRACIAHGSSTRIRLPSLVTDTE